MCLDIEAILAEVKSWNEKFQTNETLYPKVGMVQFMTLAAEVERLRAQVDRVRKLHQEDRPMKTPAGIFMTPCAHCHLREFPCPTIQALEETE